MLHLTIKIHGNVQGVNFRYYTMKKARDLGIAGFVKNEPDGAVYVKAEGERGALDEFLKWCRQGPAYANVDKVEYEFDAENLHRYSGFRIEY